MNKNVRDYRTPEGREGWPADAFSRCPRCGKLGRKAKSPNNTTSYSHGARRIGGMWIGDNVHIVKTEPTGHAPAAGGEG